jgi:hypothetical protein
MSHHRYSRNPDHIRRRNVPAPDNAAIDNHLKELLSTSVYSQQAYYRRLGMRDRILTLPLMVAAVVTLLWHQVPSVNELTRMLNRKDLLWAKATKVSRQALSERFLSFPYALFEGVFHTLVPRFKRLQSVLPSVMTISSSSISSVCLPTRAVRINPLVSARLRLIQQSPTSNSRVRHCFCFFGQMTTFRQHSLLQYAPV